MVGSRSLRLQFLALCCALFAIAEEAPAVGPPPPPYASGLANLNPRDSVFTRVGDQLLVETKDATGLVSKTTYSLEHITTDRVFFHWTTDGTPDRWMHQGGKILPDEIDWLATPNTGMQAFGPGWYVSSNPIDSASFGASGVAAKTPQDYWMLQATLEPKDPEEAKLLFSKLREQGILGTRATGTWYTVFDPLPASKLEPIQSAIAYASLMQTHEGNEAAVNSNIQILAERFGLRPNPYIAANEPELNRLLLGETLNPADFSTIVRRNFSYLTGTSALQRTIYQALSDEQKIALLKTIAPPNSPQEIANLLIVEQSFGGLPKAEALAQLYPAHANLLTGKALTEAETQSMHDAIQAGRFDAVGVNRDSPLVRRIQEEFAPDFRQYYGKRIGSIANGSSWEYDNIIKNARSWGVPVSLLDSSTQEPGIRLSTAPFRSFAEVHRQLSEQGRNTLDAYLLVDQADVGEALAEGNLEPWKLYDHPMGPADTRTLLEHWRDTITKKKGENLDYWRKFMGLPAEQKVEFRQFPAAVGGDIHVPGTASGFFRASEENVQTLRSNPYLTVTAIPDPAPISQARPSFLVRYEYPSAKTWHRFEQLLDDNLKLDLKVAEASGALADPNSPTSRALTARVVAALSNDAESKPSFLEQYVSHLALHPFSANNENLARLQYVRNSANSNAPPLLLGRWDQALMTPPNELRAMRDNGDRQISRIANALLEAETANPSAPNYAGIPELYEGIFHSPVPIGSPAEHLSAIRSFLTDPKTKELLQAHRSLELDARIWDFEIGRAEKLPQEARQALLLSWARANLHPAPSTKKIFNSVLEESLRLAKSEEQKKLVVCWWFDLSSGNAPAYSESLTRFLQNLPSGLRQLYQREWIASNANPSLKFSQQFSQEVRTAAEQNTKALAVTDRVAAQRFLLQSSLLLPSNPRNPIGDLVRNLPIYLKEPGGEELLNQLFSSPSAQVKALTAKAVLLLPSGTLNEKMRAAFFAGVEKLPKADQHEIMLEVFHAKDHWLTTDAWTYISKHGWGGRHEPEGIGIDLMADPKIQYEMRLRMISRPQDIKLTADLLSEILDSRRADNSFFQAAAAKGDWDSYAGLLRARMQNLPYVQRTSPAQKSLLSQMEHDLKKLSAASPQNAAVAALADYNLNMTALPGGRLVGNPALLDGMIQTLDNANSVNRSYLVQQIIDLISTNRWDATLKKSVRDWNPDLTRSMMKRIFASSPEFGAKFMAKANRPMLDALAGDPEVAKALAAALPKMSETVRVNLLRDFLPKKISFAQQLSDSVFQLEEPATMQSIANLIHDPAYPGPHWELAVRGTATNSIPTRQLFARSLASADAASMSAENANHATAAIQFMQRDSQSGIFSLSMAQLTPAQRAALWTEQQSFLPRAARVANNPDFQRQLREAVENVPVSPSFSELEKFRSAIAILPKDESPQGMQAMESLQKVMRSLSQATNTSEQTKIVQALLTTYEQTLPANSKLSAAQAGRFLTTLQTVQDREIRMPLLKILGHVQTPDSIVAHALGVNLLDNDPELAQLALRSLEKMQLGEESVKNELIPFLSRFAREDRAHGWVGFGGTRDALKGVMTSASLDIDRYFDAMAPTTIAPSVLPTADPSCPRLFTSIAP